MSANCPQSVRGADTFRPAPPHSHAKNGGLRASTPLPLRVIGVEALDLISAVGGRRGSGWVGEARRHEGRARKGREAGEGRRFALDLGGAGRMSAGIDESRQGEITRIYSPIPVGAGVRSGCGRRGVSPAMAGWPAMRMLVWVCGQPAPGAGGPPESRPGQIAGNRVNRIEMASHQRPGASPRPQRHQPPRPESQPSGGQARSVKGLRPDPLRGLTDAPPPLQSRPGRGPILDGAGR